MKFENAKLEIEYLIGLDVVLMNSVNDTANLNDDLLTKWKDEDFGLDA